MTLASPHRSTARPVTARRTRLLTVGDLHQFRRAIMLACVSHPARAPVTAVLVPSESAARELARSIELEWLPRLRAVILPAILTRDAWYARMHRALRNGPRPLRPLEREVLMSAAARDAIEAEASPPFKLRPALIVDMLGFYDELRRRDQTVAKFEELLTEKLEGSIEDRGAARMLQQTRFLATAFRAYERRVDATGACDEHALRARLLVDGGDQPLRHLIVTVGDRTCDPPGLWIADFDLIARMPGIDSIDLVATRAMLASGWHQRLDAAMPGIEEVAWDEPSPTSTDPIPSALVAPNDAAGRRHFVVRDREEELALIARRLKAERRREPDRFAVDRHAVVFQRPLPYLYLARSVFGSARIPYRASDAVPLAAEPYAASIDLVLDVITSAFTRSSIVALLRSPHFRLGTGKTRVPAISVRAFDRLLSDAGYLGDLDLLARLVAETPDASDAHAAAQGAWRAVEGLRPLLDRAPASMQLARLREFLMSFDDPASDDDRHLRARDHIHQAIVDLEGAHRRVDDPETKFADVAARLHRWIDAQTFQPVTGAGGLNLVHADAARYGTYDAVHVVGLVEGEWPEPVQPGIFYSARLLSALGWPAEPERAAAVRAAFKDLLTLPSRSIACSTITLEEETIVEPSPLLDELDGSEMAVERESSAPYRIFLHEALSLAPIEGGAIESSVAARWLAHRIRHDSRSHPSRSLALPHAPREIAVSAVERYLECPFKYFAVHVLELDEDPEDEDVMSPRARGLFIHKVFQAFFQAWGARGAITPARLDEARELFVEVVERLLQTLGAAEAALERTRLLGSAVAPGLGDTVFRLEAERPIPVVERLLEFGVRGELTIDFDGRPVTVRIKGVADRIDLLGDGTLRLLDYKSGKAPQPRRALQLPLYAVCASSQLSARDRRDWTIGEAAYIAFGGPRTFVPMTSRGSDAEFIDAARRRLAAAVTGMRRGEFPVEPLEPFRCTFCAYASVCRKDYVGDE